MPSKKEFILLHVRRHAGEVDWILPFLYKASKKYKIITIFSNVHAYNSLRENNDLCSLWKKINNSFYIQTKNKFILRLVSKILTRFDNLRILGRFIDKLNLFFLTEIHNFDFFFKKEFQDWSKIKMVLLTNNNFSFIPKYIKMKNQELKIIRFPETTWPKPEKQLKKIKDSEINLNLLTNYYLLNHKKDKYLFGKSSENNLKQKIIFTGYLKYQKWWIKKILSENSIKKPTNSFIILVITRPPRNIKKGDFSKESYRFLVSSIMQISSKIKNSLVIFKTHPNTEGFETKFLKSILLNYNNKSWKVLNTHTLKLAKISDICISFQTSACMDCLALNKFVIEYWLNKSDYNFLFKHNKKFISVFNYFGLVKSIDTKKKLENLILKYRKSKKSISIKNQLYNFSKLNKKETNINELINYISKNGKV